MYTLEEKESGKNYMSKDNTKKILDSFFQSLIFDFEEYAYQNPVMIETLRKSTLSFNSKDQCYTSGNTIIIGTTHPAFTDDVPSYVMMKRAQGIIAKEFAHILYTNSKDYALFLDRSVQSFKKASIVAKHVFNVFESYRVEYRFSESNNYYKKIFFMKRYPTIKKMLTNWKEKTHHSDMDIAEAAIDSFSIMAFTRKPIFSKNKKLNALILSLYPLVLKAEKAKDTKEVGEITHKALSLFEKLNIELEKESISEEATEMASKLNSRLGSPSPLSATNTSAGASNSSTSVFDENTAKISDITSALEQEVEPVEPEDLEKSLDNEIESQLEELEKEAISEKQINDFLYGDKSEAKEEVKFQEEKKIQDLSEFMPAIHHGVKLKINTRMKRYHKDDYEQQKKALSLPISKLVSRISELKQQKIDDFDYYQTSGSLDSGSLARFVAFNDTDVFKQENVEEENMSMDVMILVDCSGSNASAVHNTKNDVYLPRYKVNQMMTIYLHEAFKQLGFRHSVWGFDTGGQERISPMVGFTDCFESDSGLNLKDIDARGSNRDGYHIRLAGQHLNNHAKSNKKLLIVISDGQPAAPGYGGPSAMKDIVDTQEELKKLGVVTAGIFTGSEQENQYFEDMYEKAHFLNNESIFEFDEELYKLVSKEFEDDDDIY